MAGSQPVNQAGCVSMLILRDCLERSENLARAACHYTAAFIRRKILLLADEEKELDEAAKKK